MLPHNGLIKSAAKQILPQKGWHLLIKAGLLPIFYLFEGHILESLDTYTLCPDTWWNKQQEGLLHDK